MNKDRVQGKIKDATGRIERQADEWTGDTKAQVKGAMKQVEGKAQNAWGKAKDAMKKPAEGEKTPPAKERDSAEIEEEEEPEDLRRHTG
jgi:uncharacterized protein YjbJ (UPF0337 family)